MTTTPVLLPRAGGLEFPRSKVALELPPGLDFEEWKQIGIPLLEAGQSLMWWVGDWLNYGHTAYQEGYTAAAEWTGMEFQTLANAKWVCQNVETSRRREVLSFGHHAAVAALDADLQDELLDLAVREALTVQGLRGEVRRRNDAARADAEEAARRASDELRRLADVANAGPERPAPAASSSLVAQTATVAGPRLEGAVRLVLPAGHEKQLVDALNRTAAGLRSWFDGEGLDAEVHILR